MNPEYQQVVFIATRPAEGFPIRFGVVTAYNPDGIAANDTRNAAASQELKRELHEAGKVFFAVIGCSPDLAHREPGYGFASESAEEGLKLGRKFKQEAVFWVEDGLVHLLSCGEGVGPIVGEWNRLVVSLNESGGDRSLHGNPMPFS